MIKLGWNSENEHIGTQSFGQSRVSYVSYNPNPEMEHLCLGVNDEQFPIAFESAYEKCSLSSHFSWGPSGVSNVESTVYIPIQNMLNASIQIGYDALCEDTRDMRCSAQ